MDIRTNKFIANFYLTQTIFSNLLKVKFQYVKILACTNVGFVIGNT